ncbi:MAG: hypothetical protein VKN72_01915 [Nostocales cyanobacterium 94392]|nr:hypothetical protein [Nostocales cyanobacterium 94392]
MTKSIKKVFNYALLGTIVNVSATAQAQASLLENVAPDDDLTKTPQNQLLSDSKNTLSETRLSNKPDSCISLPELDLCNQFTRDNNKNSLNYSLFQQAQSTIQSIEAAEHIEVKIPRDGIKYIIYNIESTSSQNQQQSNLDTYTTSYTSVWQSKVSHKKKVPESSALLGLIAFYLFAAKHRSAKNSLD